MKSVGVKILKNELSKYLSMVREGEVVYVTDRGSVVAEIRKPARKAKPKSRWEEFLDREEKAGRLIRAKTPKKLIEDLLKDSPPLPPDVDFLKTLEEMRVDRF